MIIVVEVWHLKPELSYQALRIMQEMDDMMEPPAHRNPGWCGHAKFLQSSTDPTRVLMIYPWRNRELHDKLAANEEPMLLPFYQEYCTRPRELRYFTELPVEHED